MTCMSSPLSSAASPNRPARIARAGRARRPYEATATTAIATEISVEGTSVTPSWGLTSPSSTRCAVSTAMAAAKSLSSVDGMEEVSATPPRATREPPRDRGVWLPLQRCYVSAGEAAVDQEGRRRDVGRLVRGQEQRRVGELDRLREAPHRQVHHPPRRLLGIVGVELAEQRRVDRPWAERVDPHAAAGELDAQLARQRQHAA